MKTDSKAAEALIKAFKKGYRITKDGEILNPKGKPLNGVIGIYKKMEYKRISTKNNRQYAHVFVHQLQAYQKYGDLIFKKECVRHLNGNSLDNSWDNIEIGSQQDNMLDIEKEKRTQHAIIASSHVKKHNHSDIINYYNEGHTYKEIMERFNIKSKGTISFIIKESIDSKK